MKATKEKVENHEAYLTIEIEPAEMEKSMEGAYQRLVQQVRIPGFRKGKAPRAIFERYVSKDSMFEDAIDHLVPDIYEQALKEQELEAIAQPHIEITQTEPVIMKAVVPLKPVVTLGDYKAIKVAREEINVTEKNLDDVIEQLRHQHATWETADRAVKHDDLISMDIESTVEGKPFINQKGAQYQTVEGQTYPIPGFCEQLIGIKKGDEKEFKLTVPADFSQKEIAGKEAALKVKINEIKQEKLPEINDDLAKMVNPDLLTVTAMREAAEKELRQRAEERTKVDFEQQLIDAVVALSQIDFPPVMVESEINRILNQRFQNNRQSMENYLKTMNKTEQELRDELRAGAAKNVSRALALSKVAEDGKIEVTEADIDAEIEVLTKNATEKKEDLLQFFNSHDVRHSIMHTLESRKTFQLLSDIALANKGTEPAKDEKETKEPKKTRKKKEDTK